MYTYIQLEDRNGYLHNVLINLLTAGKGIT